MRTPAGLPSSDITANGTGGKGELRPVFQQAFDVSQVATQILGLLLDSSTTGFAAGASAFRNAEIGLAGLFTIGSGFVLPICLWINLIYDLFTDLSSFVEQTLNKGTDQSTLYFQYSVERA